MLFFHKHHCMACMVCGVWSVSVCIWLLSVYLNINSSFFIYILSDCFWISSLGNIPFGRKKKPELKKIQNNKKKNIIWEGEKRKIHKKKFYCVNMWIVKKGNSNRDNNKNKIRNFKWNIKIWERYRMRWLCHAPLCIVHTYIYI